MNSFKKYVGLLGLLIFCAHVRSETLERPSTWLHVKDTAKYVLSHPVQAISACSKICAKSSGLALAAGVLGYYAIRGIKNIAVKLNISVANSSLKVLGKPIKRIVILTGLVLLAYECGRSLLNDVKQTDAKPATSAAL
jgi:hypothetical protein